MSDEKSDPRAFLGTYADWVEGFDSTQQDEALADQWRLRQGRLRDGQEYNRTTPSGLTRSAYDNVRTCRSSMDTGDWQASTGYSGVEQPGMHNEAQRQRWQRVAELEEGF